MVQNFVPLVISQQMIIAILYTAHRNYRCLISYSTGHIITMKNAKSRNREKLRCSKFTLTSTVLFFLSLINVI